MTKKQIEKNILGLTAIRDNVRDNIYNIECELEQVQSDIDEAISQMSMAEDSMSDLDSILEKLKEELTNE